jgi:hypothetical protein
MLAFFQADIIWQNRFDRSFACLAPGRLLIGYGSQTMAVGRENMIAARLGLARLMLWGALNFLFQGRRAFWYSISDRHLSYPDEFRTDVAALFELPRNGAIHPVVIAREPLAAAEKMSARASMLVGSAARSCCCHGSCRRELCDH